MGINEILRNPRARRSLIVVINTGALATLTASLGFWTWLFISPPALPPTYVPANNTPPSARPLDIQPLLTAHLFGQIPAPEAEIPLSTQPSSLNLVLTGIIGVKEAGLAIISVNDQPQEPFVVGQTITGNAVLHAVYPDRVTISRNGVVENLLLEQGSTAGLPPLPSSHLTGPFGQMGVSGPAVNSKLVRRDRLYDQVRTTDAIKQSVFAPVSGGLLVQTGQRNHILESFGVLEGDLVRSINGQNLKTMDDAMQAYQQLLTTVGSTPVQIEITRQGRPQTLQIRLE